jgi:hypothetical protein
VSTVVSFRVVNLANPTTMFILKDDGTLSRRSIAASDIDTWVVDSGVTAFAPLDDNTVFYVKADGSLVKKVNEQSPQVTTLYTGVRAFKVVNLATIFVLKTDGTLWRGDLSGSLNLQVDANVQAFWPADDTTIDTIFVLGNDGNLWRETVTGAVPPPRTEVDGHVRAFKPLNENSAVVLGTDLNLWVETVTGDVPPPRYQADGNVQSFEALDGTRIAVLGQDGSLWASRVTGQVPPARILVSRNTGAFKIVGTNNDQVLVLADDHTFSLKALQFPPPRRPFPPCDLDPDPGHPGQRRQQCP